MHQDHTRPWGMDFLWLCPTPGCWPDPGNLQYFSKESKLQGTKRLENRPIRDWDQEQMRQHCNICGNRSRPVIFVDQPFIQRLHRDHKHIYMFDWPASPAMESLFFDAGLDNLSLAGQREPAKRASSPIMPTAGPSRHNKKMRKSGGRGGSK